MMRFPPAKNFVGLGLALAIGLAGPAQARWNGGAPAWHGGGWNGGRYHHYNGPVWPWALGALGLGLLGGAYLAAPYYYAPPPVYYPPAPYYPYGYMPWPY